MLLKKDVPKQYHYYFLSNLFRYDEAVDSLRREIGFHQEAGNISAVGRLTVAIVLVQLARGDAVAAEKAYKVSNDYVIAIILFNSSVLYF